jgi:hypothetical protein
MSREMKNGRLLSKILRMVGEEETELLLGESPTDDDRMVTKYEAMARKMWRQALGYEETIVYDDGPSKKVMHQPDMKVAKELMDRVEGRAPTAVEDSDTRPSTAKRVTDEGLKRIAKAGGLGDA